MISAKMICDSIDPRGNRLRTLEVIMPRYILAEFNTHRMESKNSASSRAIPLNKMIESVETNPFIPYAWQVDHKGMQGTKYITNQINIDYRNKIWLKAKDNAIRSAKYLNDGNIYLHGDWVDKEEGVTKQLCNRLLEPFMYHKVLVSGTEWDNFFNLRCPQYQAGSNDVFKSWKDVLEVLDWEKETIEDPIMFPLLHNKGQADIHMMFLAEAIWDATNESIPTNLKEGEWHIPYGGQMEIPQLQDLYKKYKSSGYDPNNPIPDEYYYEALTELQRKISVARCARLSYQTLGDNPEINYEKDLELYDVLAKSGHFSPFEHVARVMNDDEYFTFNKGYLDWDENKLGFSPTKDSQGWCYNYRGFIQERYLLEESWKG